METLAPRQEQALRLRCEGRHRADVAAVMGVAPGTLRVYFTAIYKKLGLTALGTGGYTPTYLACYRLGQHDARKGGT